MKFKQTSVHNFNNALRGMRNALASWDKSDSYYNEEGDYVIGPNDLKLAGHLIKAGSSDRKFLRQIFVSVDITAPLYWWKEFSTYKVGTVENSTSTMHKLASTPITLECFETDDYVGDAIKLPGYYDDCSYGLDETWVRDLIWFLENLRQKYLETKDKRYWKELIRWLPEGWSQTRTVTMNYENIYSMVHQRLNHKLNEWSGKDDPELDNFVTWARELPYAKEFIFWDIDKEDEEDAQAE